MDGRRRDDASSRVCLSTGLPVITERGRLVLPHHLARVKRDCPRIWWYFRRHSPPCWGTWVESYCALPRASPPNLLECGPAGHQNVPSFRINHPTHPEAASGRQCVPSSIKLSFLFLRLSTSCRLLDAGQGLRCAVHPISSSLSLH